MTGVGTALWTMAAIVGVGWVLGRFRLLGDDAARVLARVTFTVAIPALLVSTVAHADLHLLLSRVAVVTAATTGLVALAAALVLRLAWHRDLGEATVGTLAASYLNAAHLGIPVAVYVVGDAVAAVPTLLFQQLVLAPVAFALLDRAPGTPADGEAAAPTAPTTPSTTPTASTAGRPSVLGRTLRNPIIVASLTGLALAALPWDAPDVVYEPFRVLGAAAAPMALVAFGMSLAVARPAGERWLTRDLTLVVVLRGLVHPALAASLGLALGLEGRALLAAVTMASLPTAQNVLVFALQYGRGTTVARDAGLVTTLVSAPVLAVVAALLG